MGASYRGSVWYAAPMIRLVALCLLLAACATHSSERASSDPRAELAGLHARIEAIRSGLGLSRSDAPALDPRFVRIDAAPADHPARPERCLELDAGVGEVCNAATRICVLDSGGCLDAREDCRNLRSLGDSCR